MENIDSEATDRELSKLDKFHKELIAKKMQDRADVRKRPNESSADVCRNKEITVHDSGKKLKTDQHDKTEDSQGKGTDVVVSDNDSGELKKQEGGDLGKITAWPMELDGKDDEIFDKQVFGMENYSKELLVNTKDVAAVKKRLYEKYSKEETEDYEKMKHQLKREHDKTMEQFNSVSGLGDLGKITDSSMELERQDGKVMIDVQEISKVDHSLKELAGKMKDELNNILNELKKERDKSKYCIINYVLGGAELGKGKDVVVSGESQMMIHDQEISEVDHSLKELVGKIKAMIDVKKKFSKILRQHNIPFVCSEKEIHDYKKKVDELEREYDKTMQLYLNSIGDSDDGVNQSDGSATEESSQEYLKKKQADDDVGKRTESDSSDDTQEY